MNEPRNRNSLNDGCRRLRLDFQELPEALYAALLDEFRRQFPDYDGGYWRWDVVASDAEHLDAEAIYLMCEHSGEEHLCAETDK